MRCPVCKADNSAGPQCRRCKADLSLLFALEEQRQRLMREAAAAVAGGRWQEAAALAEQAHGLRRDEDSRRLRAVARLVQGDCAAAWVSYQDAPSGS